MTGEINKHKFNIVTNSAGQRILIVDDGYRFFVYEVVPFNDFDAIFFETEDYSLLKRQILSIISVDNSPNYSFKALFIKQTITNKTALNYADGICSGVESPELIKETKRIKERFISLKFKVFDREPSFWTPERRIFHVVRSCLLRSDQFPEWQLYKLSALGYAIPRFEILLKYKFISTKEWLVSMSKLYTQHKLLELGDLKAIINLCPHCYEGRLLFNEVCPKCETIDIEEVQMIHHFRCANISAESSYMNNGKLVCPKCKIELKHIGVDYDRPASMYHCRHNNIHFATPTIKAVCLNCHNTNELSKLVKTKLFNLKYTPLGLTTFTQNDHVEDSDETPKFPSIYSYKSFIEALKIRVYIARHNLNLRTLVFRLRITSEDDYEMINNVVIQRIYDLHPNAIISFKNDTFYVLQSFTRDTTEEEIAANFLKFREYKKSKPNYTFDGDYIELDINMEIDRIIALL